MAHPRLPSFKKQSIGYQSTLKRTHSSSGSKKQIVRSFLNRHYDVPVQQQKQLKSPGRFNDKLSMNMSQYDANDAELFAERYSKFSVRDFKNNTRLNINNNEYQAQWPKRDRAIRYWQDRVVNHHLPSIDKEKAVEMEMLKSQIHRSHKRGGNKPDFQVTMGLNRQFSANASPPTHGSRSNSRQKKAASRNVDPFARRQMSAHQLSSPERLAQDNMLAEGPKLIEADGANGARQPEHFNLVSWNDLEDKEELKVTPQDRPKAPLRPPSKQDGLTSEHAKMTASDKILLQQSLNQMENKAHPATASDISEMLLKGD